MSCDFTSIQGAVEESLSNLNQLGSNLQTRVRKIEDSYFPQKLLKTQNSAQNIFDKLVKICDLTKKSVDNIERNLHDAFVTHTENYFRGGDESTMCHSNSRILHDINGLKVIIPPKILLNEYLKCRVNIPFVEKHAVDTFSIEFEKENLPTDTVDCIKHVKRKKKVAFVDEPIIIDDFLNSKNDEDAELNSSDDCHSEDFQSPGTIGTEKSLNNDLDVSVKNPLKLRDMCLQMVQKSVHGTHDVDSEENASSHKNSVEKSKIIKNEELAKTKQKIKSRSPINLCLSLNKMSSFKKGKENNDNKSVELNESIVKQRDEHQDLSIDSQSSEDQSVSTCELDNLSDKRNVLDDTATNLDCNSTPETNQLIIDKTKQDSSSSTDEYSKSKTNKKVDENTNKSKEFKVSSERNKRKFKNAKDSQIVKKGPSDKFDNGEIGSKSKSKSQGDQVDKNELSKSLVNDKSKTIESNSNIEENGKKKVEKPHTDEVAENCKSVDNLTTSQDVIDEIESDLNKENSVNTINEDLKRNEESCEKNSSSDGNINQKSEMLETLPKMSDQTMKISNCDIRNDLQNNDIIINNEAEDEHASLVNNKKENENKLSENNNKTKPFIRCISINKLLSSPKRQTSNQADDVIVLDTPSPHDQKLLKKVSPIKPALVKKQLFKKDRIKTSKLQKDVSESITCDEDVIKIDSDNEVIDGSVNIEKEMLDKIQNDIESGRCVAKVNITEMESLNYMLRKHALNRITKYGKVIIKKSVMDDTFAKKSLLHHSSSEDISEGAASADDSDSDISTVVSPNSKQKFFRKRTKSGDRRSSSDNSSSDRTNQKRQKSDVLSPSKILVNEMGRRLRGRNNESDSSTSGKDKTAESEINKLNSVNNVGKYGLKKDSETLSDSSADKAKKRKVENAISKDDKASDKNGIENHEEEAQEVDESTEDEMPPEFQKEIMNESSEQKNESSGKDAELLAKTDLLDSNDTDETETEKLQSNKKVNNSNNISTSSSRRTKKRTKDKLLTKTDNCLKMVDTEDSSDEVKKKGSEKSKSSDESSSELCSSRKRSKVVLNSDSEQDDNNKKKTDDESHSQSGSEESKKETESSDSSSDDFKVTRRKKKSKTAKGSDGSNDSSDSSSDEKKRKKKGRIIKKPAGDSDSDNKSDDDSEEEGTKKGRKNIRRLMRRDDLEEATLKAEKEERLRRLRISDRQKLYNSVLFDESGKPEEAVVDKVVLDFDPDTKEPIIQVDSGIVKKLKPHQANGVKFMWDACFESVKQIEKRKGSGCILAHCMGLGKTLQVISLIHTLLKYPKLTKTERILVVCPLSTVLNWVNEFKIWLKFAKKRNSISIYEISKFKQNYERAYQLQEWLEEGGVCVLGYEMFRNLSADNPKKFRKKILKSFQESLVDPGPDLVICDEGHLLKNEKTSLSQSMNRIKTRRRIVLTGTPLQNNLKEYYCMVQFVKPNLLGKYNEYLNRFVNPITNGQYTDSTDHDIRIMKRRSHVLHKLLDGAVQRRDYAVLAPFLPPKHEYVIFITVTDIQAKLYQHYLDNYSRRPHPDRKNSGFLFPDFQSLQRIWTHPLVLKANSERYELMLQKKRDKEEEDDTEGSLVDFIDDDESDASSSASSSDGSSDDGSIASDDSKKKSKKKKDKKPAANNKNDSNRRRGTRANPGDPDPELEIEALESEVKKENPTEWWIPLVSDVDMEDMALSNKLVLLFEILRECEAIGDKVLVFSQSLYSLDLIEQFLSKIDEATQKGAGAEKLCGHVGSWSQGLDYFRLDGQTSCENRSIWCKSFNREDNPRARLFLISTRAGGLGINLVAANRVIIFDVSWNPSHDVQSIFRIYRFGQKKPCYVYRFLAMGTMEEKIYERQVTKQAISKRVIDEQQIDRHYAENDLAELYVFTPKPLEPRTLPPLPKDRLFAEMLRKYETLIYKYHEHDSLLENKEEETLTEEERKAAWEDFENEKNKPPPLQQFPNMNMMNMNMMNPGFNGMGMAGQTSLMINNIMGLIRKENPALSEQQLTSLIPTLLTRYFPAEQSSMQKMASLMQMSPGMMPGLSGVPVGTGGMAHMGYQSWQHQQQLQNMQRLQQQQQSGMKYYAGGLGSRDPISMQEAQQRQKEMVLSGMADNIPRRGRPPGTLNTPITNHAGYGGLPLVSSLTNVPMTGPKNPQPIQKPGDIVNLDDSE